MSIFRSRLFRAGASPLSVRLLLVILVSSSLVTLVITAVQLAGEYYADVDYIERRVAQVEDSYLGPITNSVWNFNETQYVMQLEGILTLQDVVFAEILGPRGGRIAAGGDPRAPADLVQHFPLRVENYGRELDIGTLAVVASFRRVYRDLLNRGLTILIKRFNDTYGHLQGDDALKRIAQVLGAAVQGPQGAAARYGGEELMLMLPNIDRDGAHALLEQLRQRIQALAIAHRSSQTAEVVTVSGGCVVYVSAQALNHVECRLLVDDLLYQAKQEGRNRVKVLELASQRPTGVGVGDGRC
ncbi:hypothetical protein CKO31_11970 [Thiohalocapsa halophila]|uniref:diguanylate cyclase n=1 Tax=Thiohalocapsa halophila TaxID=69359 RepID=A0ABS1CHR3_9GAMM|nr:GGDEF domain-containing protein [Thiohalocapsa halophila]MBK1631444.1 hypothetical protein [Thiohalocapsa halophila]